MTLQEEIVFDDYFRCYVIGGSDVHIMRYDPRQPHVNRYVRNGPSIEPAMYERVRQDCLKLTEALGYEFDTLEFAVRDGIPYAIDFLNPAPDADPASVGEDNFRWVLEHSAKWLIERVRQPAGPSPLRWPAFLSAPAAPQAPAPAPRPAKKPTARRVRRTEPTQVP
jgi:hypothetical protein